MEFKKGILQLEFCLVGSIYLYVIAKNEISSTIKGLLNYISQGSH